MCSRICWHEDNNHLRIISKHDLDCIFEIKDDGDGREPTLLLRSAVKIDNMFENKEMLQSNHLVRDRCYLEASHDFQRLIRMNQDYKTNMQHTINLARDKGEIKSLFFWKI